MTMTKNAKKLLLGVLVLSVLALGLTLTSRPPSALAHGSGEDGEVIELTVLMGEFFFQVEGQEPGEALVLEAGHTYEIVFRNVGRVPHEAMFGRELMQMGGRVHGYQIELFDGVNVRVEGVVGGKGFELESPGLSEIVLDPGQELIVSFTLPEEKKGEWEIGCFLPGHYQAGMKAPILVE